MRTHAEAQNSQQVIDWYENSVRPFLSRLQSEKITDFNLDYERLKKLIELADHDLAVCFLGNSGVGKSTLINAMVGGVESVVPFGGIGPLTAQAVIVQYRATNGFEVDYHKSDRLSQTIFALEQFFKSDLGNSTEDALSSKQSEDIEFEAGDSASAGPSEEQDRRRDTCPCPICNGKPRRGIG